MGYKEDKAEGSRGRMNKYGQIVYKYLKNNKRRTIATMIGIVFSAMLIFGVVNIIFCGIKKGIDNAESIYKYDAIFYNITDGDLEAIENYPGVEKVYTGGLDKKIYMDNSLVFIDDFNENPYEIELISGRYPENENEAIGYISLFKENSNPIGEKVWIDKGEVAYKDGLELELVGTFDIVGDIAGISYYDYSELYYLTKTDGLPKEANVVFVKYDSPYKIKRTTKKIAENTGAEYIINDSIAFYYCQTSDGSVQAVFAALIFALVVIIAWMSAAVIKNTLRLSVAERLRDYGILRCAGASLKQMYQLIRKEAVVMGVISSIIGIIISYIVQVIFSLANPEYNFTHLYILAAICTILICVAAMLVAAIDPCKLIKKLTPVEAVRNQLHSSDKEKIKVRKARLITKVFGVGGAYAYKNALRNPKQFASKVIALTVGIILFACVQTFCNAYLEMYQIEYDIRDSYYNTKIEYELPPEMYGEYEINEEEGWSTYDEDTVDEEKFSQIREKIYNYIKGVPEVGDTIVKRYKSDYSDVVFTYPIEKKPYSELYTKEYLKFFDGFDRNYSEDETSEEFKKYIIYGIGVGTNIYSYDKDMFKMYKDNLICGTCDPDKLGDDGIILFNKEHFTYEDEDTGLYLNKTIDVYNLELGDTISFISAPKDVYERRVEEATAKYSDYIWDVYGESETIFSDCYIKYKVFDELYKEGYIKTYTIKGIVDANSLENTPPCFIMTKDQFMELLPGYENTYPEEELLCRLEKNNETLREYLWDNYAYSEYFSYIEAYETMENIKKATGIILLIVLLFMTINVFNNASSSVIFRRGEFAMLRCIGMSKRRLMRIVLLGEGLLATIISSVLGIGLSTVIMLGVEKYMTFLGFGAMVIPIKRVLIGVLILFVIMTIASGIPLLSIKKEIAPELAESDE